MSALLPSTTTDTVGSSLQFNAPTTVLFKGSFNGAEAILEFSDDGVDFVPMEVLSTPLPVNVNAEGTFYIRATTRGSRAGTDISADTTTTAVA